MEVELPCLETFTSNTSILIIASNLVSTYHVPGLLAGALSPQVSSIIITATTTTIIIA